MNNDKLPVSTTLEWFGATTFRMKTRGLTIFLDSWLDRPSTVPQYLKVADVDECDYIVISHAHFDHLPGADRIAKKTGAIIIANGEAINVMRGAGVPENQLIAISGGERIPLFTRAIRDKVTKSAPSMGQGSTPGPAGPPQPDAEDAVVTLHAWPSLHCLMPLGPGGDHLEFIDTGAIFRGAASHSCTLDITRALTYGLGSLVKRPQLPPQLPNDLKVLVEYMKDRNNNQYSNFDGGQLMYNFLIGNKTLLWSGHLGAYEGIVANLEPKPDFAILAIAGRANLNGKPFDGSASEFAVRKIKWLHEPQRAVWCLHDQSPLKPYYIDTKAATNLVHKETKTRILDLNPAEVFKVW